MEETLTEVFLSSSFGYIFTSLRYPTPSQEMQVEEQASGSPKAMVHLCQCPIPSGSPNRKFLFHTHLL